MKKLIIHIGYPKTATKTIQGNVVGSLQKKGVLEFLNHVGREHAHMGEFMINELFEYCIGFRTDISEEQIDVIDNMTATLSIFSNESLAHVTNEFPTSHSRRGVQANIKRLHEVFSPYFDEIDVVMVIRNQVSMIHSYYTQEYFNIIRENPNFSSVEAWIASNFGESIEEQNLAFNYFETYNSIVNYFGKSHSYVLVYEDLIHEKESFVSQWCSILNIDMDLGMELFEKKGQNITVKKENKRFTDKQSIGSKLSIFSRKIGISHGLRRKVKNVLPKRVLNVHTNKSVNIPDLTEADINLINKRFCDSNKKLCAESGIQLIKLNSYGYSLS